MRPLLVGELNPFGSDPRSALWPRPSNSSGGRLCRALGLTTHQYLRRFERINLCYVKWDLQNARNMAQALRQERRGQPKILLGAKVCGAFGLEYQAFHEYVLGDQINNLERVFVLPHPSGLNRVWNDPRAAEMTQSLLAEYLV